MSFSHSFIAAPCDLAPLQAAVLEAWPFELAEPPVTLQSWDEAYEWASPRCEYLSGRHPDDVKLLYQDGTWAVLADISMCMAGDEERLAALSRRLGRVVVGTTQGTVGFAQLQVLEAGAVVRLITGQDGHTSQAGTPLPEEAGVTIGSFYLDELDAIWRRLGLTSFLGAEPAGRVVGVHVLDRTQYPPEVVQALATVPPADEKQRRPWWRFW